MSKVDFSTTMLIIGAGAHVPYGYPTAKILSENIKDLCRKGKKISLLPRQVIDLKGSQKISIDDHKNNICYLLNQLEIISKDENYYRANGHDIKVGSALDEFVKNFAESQVYSIDAYMANLDSELKINIEAIKIGKLLIAYFIYFYENKTEIGFHSPDWIQYIINTFLRQKDHLDNFFSNPPKIYSFNYDNLFEKSIEAHLKKFHHMSNDQALELVGSLNIKHVYGSIISNSTKNINSIVQNAQKELMVIGDERSKDLLDQTSLKILEDMIYIRNIYLLGFGYDPINVDLIFRNIKSESPHGRRFFSTNIGIDENEIDKISKITGLIRINFFKHLNKDVDSLELISKSHPIFSSN